MLSNLRQNLLPIAIFIILMTNLFIAVFSALLGAEYARAAWIVDKDRPTTSITATCNFPTPSPISSGGTCGATQATVTTTCTDIPAATGSGCLHIHYSANSGTWQTATSSASPLIDTYAFPITLNSVPQSANVKAHSKDGAGNMECPHGDNGVATNSACPISFDFTFTGVSGWWQVTDGDVMAADLGGAAANIKSLIPEGCSGQCQPYLNLEGAGGYPGVVSFGKVPPSTETANFGTGTPLSKVAKNSGERWLANSGYAGRRYDYNWFEAHRPSDVVLNTITDATTTGGYFISGGTASRGYVWYKKTGNLTMNGELNMESGSGQANNSRKVILLVDGDLTISGRIRIEDGLDFFTAIVKGNIVVDPSIPSSGQSGQPALEGIFMADGVVRTGTSQPGANDNQLRIRGAFIGWSGISFQRNLGDTNNENKPGELIEYAPDLLFTFPRELFREGLIWREIAP